MKLVWVLLFPLFLFGQSFGLKNFIESAAKSNGLIQAKGISIQAKKEQIEAAKSAYWPTVDIGADYSLQNPNYIVSPGEAGNIFASIRVDLYDGGRKDAIVRSRSFEHEASLFEKAAFEKSVTLEIVRYYYGIKTWKATLRALEKRATELSAQISRVKRFKGAGLSTQEDIDKLVSVYENNNFTIENAKLSLERAEENLKLITGLSAKQLKRNYFLEPKRVEYETFETIKMLQAKANAMGENAVAVDAGYLPQVNLSDTYHKSHSDDFVTVPGGFAGDQLLVDHQNKLTLSVNMRLFDKGKMAKESEAIRYQKLALLSQIAHAKKEQRMNYKLASKSLRTSRAKLKSAKAALKAARSTYEVIRQKYEVGLSDNIAFLDALAQRTLAEARYKETVYDYEVKKSIYYYYAGKDPKVYIR